MVNASAPRAIPGILAAGVHAGWVQHTVSTAKCDCCPGRGDSIVQRCVSCRLQICRDCVVSGRLDTDARHVLDVDDVSWVAPKSKRAKKKQPIVRRKLTASVRGRGSNRGRGRGRQVSARVVKDETPSPMLAMSPLTEADSSQDGHSTRQVQSPDGSVQTPDVPLTGLTSPQLSSIQQSHEHGSSATPKTLLNWSTSNQSQYVSVADSRPRQGFPNRVSSTMSRQYQKPRIRRRPTPYPQDFSPITVRRSRRPSELDQRGASPQPPVIHPQGFFQSPAPLRIVNSYPTPENTDQQQALDREICQGSYSNENRRPHQVQSSVHSTHSPIINSYATGSLSVPSTTNPETTSSGDLPQQSRASYGRWTPWGLENRTSTPNSNSQQAEGASNVEAVIFDLAAALEADSLATQREYPLWALDTCLRHEISRSWSRGTARLLAVESDDGHAFHILLSATYIASIRLDLRPLNTARQWLCDRERELCERGAMEPLRVTAQRAFERYSSE